MNFRLKRRVLLVAISAACGVAVGACSGHTTSSTGVSQNQATLNAKATCGASYSNCYYDWGYRAVPNGSWQYTPMQGPRTDETDTESLISEDVSGLTPGTKYEVEICGLPNQHRLRGRRRRWVSRNVLGRRWRQPSQSALFCADSTGSNPNGDVRGDIPNSDATATTFLTDGPLGDPQGKSYYPRIFNDAFNDSSIDTTIWTLENDKLAYDAIYSLPMTATASLCSEDSNGSLVLSSTHTDKPDSHGVESKGCEMYPTSSPGLMPDEYLEARIYFPGPDSTHCYNSPAFEATDPSRTDNGAAGVINIATCGTFHGGLGWRYWGQRISSGDDYSTSLNLSNSWHVFGVYRGANGDNHDYLYIDGSLVQTVNTSDNGGEERIQFISGADGDADPHSGGPIQPGSPGDVEVDWVNLWSGFGK